MLALHLFAHQQNKFNEVGSGLVKNSARNHVSGKSQLVNGGSERGKVRPGRSVADIDQIIEVRRLPDFAYLVENLRGLLAIIGAQGAAQSV